MISVVMTTYNESLLWIQSAIESVLNQEISDIELIIVHDNPNNMKIFEFINKYAFEDMRIKVIKNEKNLGLALSLNRGINISSGEYIARMDADDICMGNRFRIQLDFLEKNPEYDGVGANIQFIDENSQPLDMRSFVETDFDIIKKKLRYENVFKHPTLMFRRHLLLDLGGYNNINPAQDYELYTRAINRGYKITNIDIPLLKYRIRKNSISNSKSLLQLIHADFIQRLYRSNKLFNETELKEFENRMIKSEKHFDKSQFYYTRAFDNKSLGKKLNYYSDLILASLFSRYRRKTIFRSLVRVEKRKSHI